jgi:hypothetical protein
MNSRPNIKDLIIGIVSILTILGLFLYIYDLTSSGWDSSSSDFSLYYWYNHNPGIITISLIKLICSLTLVSTLAYWKIKKQIIGKKIVLLLSITSIIIGLLSWTELWYGSTFSYGSFRDKEGLSFPILSVLFIAYPLWNFKLIKNIKADIIIKFALTLTIFVGLYFFYKEMDGPWDLYQSLNK